MKLERIIPVFGDENCSGPLCLLVSGPTTDPTWDSHIVDISKEFEMVVNDPNEELEGDEVNVIASRLDVSIEQAYSDLTKRQRVPEPNDNMPSDP